MGTAGIDWRITYEMEPMRTTQALNGYIDLVDHFVLVYRNGHQHGKLAGAAIVSITGFSCNWKYIHPTR